MAALLRNEKRVKCKVMNISSAILAGGQSTRMGQDKATLKIGDMGLIERVYATVRNVFDDVFVVSSHHKKIQGVPATVIGDALPQGGSLVGIISALLYSRTPYVFVVACDMPFLNGDFIRHMIDQVSGEDIIVPKSIAGYEPLHAIYNRSCLSYMLRLIDANRFKIDRIFPLLNVRTINVEVQSSPQGISVFTNINTEKDLEHVRELL
jgi:molybdopterin-guanine dinucleotide biosynthesis protein A